MIPEVRRFVASLNERFPYWLHFGSKTENSLLVIMLCLIPVEETTPEAGGDVRAAFPPGALSALLFRLFTAMNGLYHQFGLTAEENAATTRQIQAYLNTFLPST